MEYATVIHGGDGDFYITPLHLSLNGVSYKTRSEAEYIARAVNLAYEAGREDVRYGMRDLLGVPHPVQEGT